MIPDLTVVIPTYNSSRTLSKCLDSIRSQTSPPLEVIVVDRLSTDGTVGIARSFGATVIEGLTNRSVARNIGIQHASSTGILLIDSDMILSRTLIDECRNMLIEHEALVIPEVSAGRGFWVECKTREREANAGAGFLEAARCFHRNLLISLGGGYNPKFEAGEDWDLHNRVKAMGIGFGRIKAKIIHDEGDSNLIGFLRKKFLYGRNLRHYVRENTIPGTKQFSPLYRILSPTIKVLPFDPAHGAGIFMLKTMELMVGGVGFILDQLNPLRNMYQLTDTERTSKAGREPTPRLFASGDLSRHILECDKSQPISILLQ